MEATLSNRIAVFHSGRTRIDQHLENERQAVTRLTGKIEKLREESTRLVKAVALIDKAIEVISANGIGKIETIVSAGMHQVFGDKTLGLVVEKKDTARGYSYKLRIKHGDVIRDPMTSFGGGVQNLVAFLLRVTLIKRFKLAKLLVIDEGFNNLSARNYSAGGNYVPQLSEMLKTLAEDHGFTILAVTHEPKLAAAARNIYEVVPGKPSPTLIKRDYVSINDDEGVPLDAADKTQEP